MLRCDTALPDGPLGADVSGEVLRSRPIPEFRRATDDDSAAVADVYLRSRKDLMPGVPLAHSDEAVREWIRRHLIPLGRTTVAIVDDQVVGFLAVSKDAEGG